MKLLLLFTGLLLFSCKSSKTNCDAYSIHKIITNDTLLMSQIHEHFTIDGDNLCLFIMEDKTVLKDTIEVKIYK